MAYSFWQVFVSAVVALSACASAPAAMQPTKVKETPLPLVPTATLSPRPRRSCADLTRVSAVEFDLDKLRAPVELISEVNSRYPSTRPLRTEVEARGLVRVGWDMPDGDHLSAVFMERADRRYIGNISIGGPDAKMASFINDALMCFGAPDYYQAVNGPERMGNRIPNVDNVKLYYTRLGLVVEGWDESSPSRELGEIPVTSLERTPVGSILKVWMNTRPDASEASAENYVRVAIHPWPGRLSAMVFIDRNELKRQLETTSIRK